VPVSVVVVFVICSIEKIKNAYICRVWALCVGVVCVYPFATFERNTRHENGQIWRVLTCGSFASGRCRFFRALFKKGRGRYAPPQ
jgi:hypothetical protein